MSDELADILAADAAALALIELYVSYENGAEPSDETREAAARLTSSADLVQLMHALATHGATLLISAAEAHGRSVTDFLEFYRQSAALTRLNFDAESPD